MSVREFVLSDLERRMRGAIDVMKSEFSGLRTGRASATILDSVLVEAYGSPTPISQLATVSVPEPRMISVQVWDKTLLSDIDRAIRTADLGLNPVVDGLLIRLPIPELNEERRKELIKIAHKFAEQSRIAVRHVRRDGMDILKAQEKDHQISQDEHHGQSEKLQKLTDDMITIIDEDLARKEKDIIQI